VLFVLLATGLLIGASYSGLGDHAKLVVRVNGTFRAGLEGCAPAAGPALRY